MSAVSALLDTLIHSFAGELIASGRADDYTDNGAGYCYDGAYNFSEDCQAAGCASDAVYWEYTATGGRELYWQDPELEGYEGKDGFAGEVDESCEHMLTLVALDDGSLWAVDFTCAQFGFSDEWPKLMRCTRDETGRATWTRP